MPIFSIVDGGTEPARLGRVRPAGQLVHNAPPRVSGPRNSSLVPPTQCTSPNIRCSTPGPCTNPLIDNNNCGSCGNVCQPGQTCTNGTCVSPPLTCASPQTLCGSTCTNTQTDTNNCGSCGAVCPSGQTCTNGACVSTCPSPNTMCGTLCTNLQNDPNNCGSCGNVCPSGQPCTSGACVPAGTPDTSQSSCPAPPAFTDEPTRDAWIAANATCPIPPAIMLVAPAPIQPAPATTPAWQPHARGMSTGMVALIAVGAAAVAGAGVWWWTTQKPVTAPKAIEVPKENPTRRRKHRKRN